MTSRMTYEPTTGQWELALLPPAAWAEASHPVEGVVVYRSNTGQLAAVVVDEEQMSDDTRALIGALAGLDVVLAETAPPTPSTAAAGGLVPTEGGHAIVLDELAGVAVPKQGTWSFDEETLRARIEIPLDGDADPDGLWVSVVDMRSGDVLAAGSLTPGVAELATTLTIAVPFSSEDVRIRVDRRSVEAPVEETPAGIGLWIAIVAVVSASVGAILGGVAVGGGTPSLDGLAVYGAEILVMLGLMTVTVMLVERVGRFPLLRPLIPAFVAAGILAWSNIFYSMLNLVGGWGTWYSQTAETLQQGSMLLLPVASAWAIWSMARKGSVE